MQALPVVLLRHPQLYVATTFKIVLLTIAMDIYLYIRN